MASQEHLDLLQQGVQVWNQWREEHPEIQPDLIEAILLGANLSRANFSRTLLWGANLNGANLESANLSNAIFFDPNFSEAALRKSLEPDPMVDMCSYMQESYSRDYRDSYQKALRDRATKLSGVLLYKANLSGAYLHKVDLSEANLISADLSGANLSGADLNTDKLSGANLSGADLSKASLSRAKLSDVNLVGANLSKTDLTMRDFSGLNLRGANLREADLEGTTFTAADLSGAILSGTQLKMKDFSGTKLRGANLREADLSRAIFIASDLSGADLKGANLREAILINTSLRNAILTDCAIFGISAWNVHLDGAIQSNLIITQKDEPIITVDNLEVAQFIYLLLNHKKLRDVLNAVTERGVLLLGRFGGGGLEILQAIATKLREERYLPIIFDFERPRDRDYTETVKALAGLSHFVIADLSGPSVPKELEAIIPDYKIPFAFICQIDTRPFATSIDLFGFPWVLRPALLFSTVEDLLAKLSTRVIEPAEEMAEKTRRAKEKTLDELFSSE